MDYLNPGGIGPQAPQLGTPLMSGLSGFIQGQQLANSDSLMQQAMKDRQLQYMMEQNKYNNQMLDNPVLASKRSLDQSTNDIGTQFNQSGLPFQKLVSSAQSGIDNDQTNIQTNRLKKMAVAGEVINQIGGELEKNPMGPYLDDSQKKRWDGYRSQAKDAGVDIGDTWDPDKLQMIQSKRASYLQNQDFWRQVMTTDAANKSKGAMEQGVQAAASNLTGPSSPSGVATTHGEYGVQAAKASGEKAMALQLERDKANMDRVRAQQEGANSRAAMGGPMMDLAIKGLMHTVQENGGQITPEIESRASGIAFEQWQSQKTKDLNWFQIHNSKDEAAEQKYDSDHIAALKQAILQQVGAGTKSTTPTSSNVHGLVQNAYNPNNLPNDDLAKKLGGGVTIDKEGTVLGGSAKGSPIDKATYDKIPPGTWYMAPNGVRTQKKGQ